MACASKISAAINGDCLASPKGFDQEALLIAKSDIVSYTLTGNILSAMTLTASPNAQGYKVYDRSKKPFDQFKITGEEKSYGTTYKKEVNVKLVGLNPTNAGQVESLVGNEYVMILKQRGVSDNSKYVVIGIEGTLQGTAPTFEAYGDAGGYVVTLTEDMSDRAAVFMWITDLATTDALYAALAV